MQSLDASSHESQKNKIVTILLLVIIIVTVSTYITSLFAFISPSEAQRWDTSIQTVNPPTINRGTTVTVTGLLEEGSQFMMGYYHYFSSAENIRWIVVVVDPNNMPIYITSGTVAGALGDINLGPLNFNIPTTAALGTYKIRVLVWTDWLPSGETRTNIIHEELFVVV